VGALVPFSPLRGYVLGMIPARERTSVTEAELNQMKQILYDSMKAGAFGISADKNLEDRPEDGSWLPSHVASKEEFLALAQVMGEFGVGQIGWTIGISDDRAEQRDMLAEMVRMSGRPLHVVLGDDEGYEWLKEMREGAGEDMRVEYDRKPFLLLSYSGSIYCGGAHPNNYYDQYLFDLRSGEEIALRDLFAIYRKDKEGDEKIDPRFKKLLLKYRVAKKGDDCYHEEDSYYSFVLYPASCNRIAVRLTGMGHAAFACELEPIARIPVREMKPLALPAAYRYYPSLR